MQYHNKKFITDISLGCGVVFVSAIIVLSLLVIFVKLLSVVI